jgi:hypothetical protein
MDDNITIEWLADEEAYIVKMDGAFIGDFYDLHDAAVYALECAEHSGQLVVLIAVMS